MRKNKNSVMAVLEAFVHDPLINWRLVENKRKQKMDQIHEHDDGSGGQLPSAVMEEETKGNARQRAGKVVVPADGKAEDRADDPEDFNTHAFLRSSFGAAFVGNIRGMQLGQKTESADRSPTDPTDELIMAQAPRTSQDVKDAKDKRSDTEQSETQLNTTALSVILRVEAKLKGKDFVDETGTNQNVLDVPAQVQKLVEEATSHVNLCQSYMGWCPFW